MRYEIASSVNQRRRRPGGGLSAALGTAAVLGAAARARSGYDGPVGGPMQNGAGAAATPRPPAAPVTTTGATTTAPGAPPAADAPGGFDADPILQQIRALGKRNVSGAEAAELAGRKQQLIGFGYDPALASLYPDQSTAEAARQNPFSIVGELARQHDTRARAIDENTNARDLFYSGHRGRERGDESHQFLGEQVGAQQALQQHLGEIATSLLAARQAEAERELTGQQAAYQRAIDQGLFAGTGAAGAAAPAETHADTVTAAMTPGTFVTRHLNTVGKQGVAAALAAAKGSRTYPAPSGYAPGGVAYKTAEPEWKRALRLRSAGLADYYGRKR